MSAPSHENPDAVPRTGTEVPWREDVPRTDHEHEVEGPLDPPEAQRNVASAPEEKPPVRRGE
ncbi:MULTISPECIES: hypothetical protein [unclassified Blastococcus]